MRKDSSETKVKWLFAAASIMMVLYGSVNIFVAYGMKGVIDAATEQNAEMFIKMVLMLLGVSVAEPIVSMLSRYFLQSYTAEQIAQAKKNRFEYMLGQSGSEKLDVSMFSTDMELLYANHYFNKVMLVYNIAQLSLAATGIVALSWKASIVVLITTFLPMATPALLQKKLKAATDNYTEGMNKYLDFVQDVMQGVQEIRMYGAFTFFRNIHDELNKNAEKLRMKTKMMNYLNAVVSMFVGSISFTAVIVACGYLTLRGEITIGVMMAVIQLMNNVASPIGAIASEIGEISSTKELAKRYQDVEPAEEEAAEDRTPVERIDVENVSFAYNEHQTILHNISLSFEHGRKYAIVGESGSGKSTLAKVLAGLNKDFDGSITMTDAKGRKIKLPCENNYIQYVSQEPYLFRLSAKDNVYFGKTESGERMRDRMEKLGIGKLFTNPSASLANRDSISGGQKQRLVIARALFHNPDVLILDEPTANLDHQNTLQTMRYITEAKCGILIVITHNTDKEFLANFDEVITIKSGELAA